MGARGPAPTPTHTLKLRGSWLAKTRAGEPDAAVEVPGCPDWLGKEAKAEWRRVAPDLERRRTLSKSDRAALASYCHAWGEFVESAAHIDSGEAFKGHMIDHPRVVMARAQERLLKWSDRFGLSPAAKARVRSEVVEEKPDNGKGRFFGQAG